MTSIAAGLIPITRSTAHAFITRYHRHHTPPAGYRFAIGAHNGRELVAVATAGRPVARHLDDGWTIEITRVASDGAANACSMLYGACWRAARALGYTRAVTYTQHGESGASLRAAGWTRAADLPAHRGWDRPGRARIDQGSAGVPRTRWEITTVGHGRHPAIEIPVVDARSGQLDLLTADGAA